MDFKDYYKALGVTREAEGDEITRAFRKNARLYHPDVNKSADAEAKFRDITEAYEVLKDPERRAAYDQLARQPAPDAGLYQPPPGWDDGFQFSGGEPDGEDVFSDFFETLFRRETSDRMRAGQGADRHARLEIDIEDAYLGAARPLTLRTPVVGADGRVTLQDRMVSVQVPKGITEGQHIRLSGQGMPAREGGPAGDLFLDVAFAPHPVYRAQGRDLYLDLPVAPWEAALGSHVVMPTPSGRVDLRIPANARSGQKLRLKGKGLPGTPAGDIYASLRIVNPTVTTSDARAVFEQMAQAVPFDPRAHFGG